MKKRMKQFFGMVLIGVLSLGCVLSVQAETRKGISSVNLHFSTDIEAGNDLGSVEITTSSLHYTIDDYEFVTTRDSWKIGDRPQVRIYLTAADERYFTSTNSGKFSLTGAGAKFVSAQRKESNEVMILTVKLQPVGGTLGDTDDAEWSSLGHAHWEHVDGVSSYQVRLYHNGNMVGSTHKTTSTSYNFSDDITRTGGYTFKVRAVPANEAENAYVEDGRWVESDEWEVDDEELRHHHATTTSNPAGGTSTPGTSKGPGISGENGGPGVSQSGAWEQNSSGWRYRNANGAYAQNTWQSINGRWYYFNSQSYMMTGWVQVSGKWYYLDNTGAMLANTTTPDGYYVGNDGAWN